MGWKIQNVNDTTDKKGEEGGEGRREGRGKSEGEGGKSQGAGEEQGRRNYLRDTARKNNTVYGYILNIKKGCKHWEIEEFSI